ncbi:MAG: hypothetical protein ABR598_02075 [Candidatus Dormibacteria bacterium]
METEQNDRESGDGGEAGQTEEKRDDHQREQVEAQAAGDTGGELKALFKEVVDDHVQFPKDVVADSKDPERRVDEEQGTTTQPGSEPAEQH